MKIDFQDYTKEAMAVIKKNKSLALVFAISIPLGVGATVYFMRKNRIVRYAKKFLGEEELRDNIGFVNEEFENMMKKYGDYYNGNQWCMSFAKAIWLQKFGKRYREDLDQLLTPSTQTTWQNFEQDNSGRFKTSKEPSKGAIVIWQQYNNGVPEWKGHAGIVQNFNKETFDTIEGNAGAIGGIDRVSEHTHSFKWNVTNGLRLKGFISIK